MLIKFTNSARGLHAAALTDTGASIQVTETAPRQTCVQASLKLRRTLNIELSAQQHALILHNGWRKTN